MPKLSAILVAIVALWIAEPARAAPNGCVFTSNKNVSLSEMIAVIRNTNGTCGLPWPALKRLVSNPENKRKLEATYHDVAAKHPDRAEGIVARLADVEAAAGNFAPMLAIADANTAAHPEDKSLANMSCFARAAHGVDIDHAMPYCDAAVANGRPGYALVNRGKAELQLGKFREAMSDFNEALSARKNIGAQSLVQAAYGRGVARLRMGDAGGRDDISAALQASPYVADDFADFGVRP